MWLGLLAARTFVSALVILLPILPMASVHFMRLGTLTVVVSVLLGLLIVALLLFARILGWLGHGSLLHVIEYRR